MQAEHPVRLTILRCHGVFLFQQATDLGSEHAACPDALQGRQDLMLEALDIDLRALAASTGAAGADCGRLERRRLANNALHYAISFLKSRGDAGVLSDLGYTAEREQELLELAGASDIQSVTDPLVVDTIREVHQFRGGTTQAQHAAARVLEILKIKAQREHLEDIDTKIFEEALALLSTPAGGRP